MVPSFYCAMLCLVRRASTQQMVLNGMSDQRCFIGDVNSPSQLQEWQYIACILEIQ